MVALRQRRISIPESGKAKPRRRQPSPPATPADASAETPPPPASSPSFRRRRALPFFRSLAPLARPHRQGNFARYELTELRSFCRRGARGCASYAAYQLENVSELLRARERCGVYERRSLSRISGWKGLVIGPFRGKRCLVSRRLFVDRFYFAFSSLLNGKSILHE